MDSAHSAYQPVTHLDMMDELNRWRLDNSAALAALNRECAEAHAAKGTSSGKPGRPPAQGCMSKYAIIHTLKEWFGKSAPQPGSVPRWMPLVNCDNAEYFFDRLGEPEWQNIEFTQREILEEFGGTWSN